MTAQSSDTNPTKKVHIVRYTLHWRGRWFGLGGGGGGGTIGASTRAPGPKSGFVSGSQSIWERWYSVCLRVNTTNLDLD